jgi:hypothetical protein
MLTPRGCVGRQARGSCCRWCLQVGAAEVLLAGDATNRALKLWELPAASQSSGSAREVSTGPALAPSWRAGTHACLGRPPGVAGPPV